MKGQVIYEKQEVMRLQRYTTLLHKRA